MVPVNKIVNLAKVVYFRYLKGVSCPTSDYYSLGDYCVVLLNVTAVNNSMAKSACESRNDTLPTFTNATELDTFRFSLS